MNLIATLLVIVAAIVIIAFGLRHLRRRTMADRATGIEFRRTVLTGSAGEQGVSARSGEVWLAVMEQTFATGSVTVAALADGNASAWFGSGEVVHTGDDAEMRTAAKNFVREASKFLGRMSAAADTSLPAPGNVRFFTRTGDGTLSYEAAATALAAGNDALSPLFGAGMKVMDQLRFLASPAD